MTLVLRKTVGSFSAGTAVEIVGKTQSASRMTVEPLCVPPDSDNYLTVSADLLVERRSATDMIPARTRKARRSEIIATKRIMAELIDKGKENLTNQMMTDINERQGTSGA